MIELPDIFLLFKFKDTIWIENINLIFTAIFIIEFLLKLYGFGFYYFVVDFWNPFDGAISGILVI